MRLELALDLRNRTEAIVKLAMPYELPDEAHARLETRGVIRVHSTFAHTLHDEILNP